MKSYTGITGRYLRTQRKRSLLTVIGIVLSVALVTGIGTIFLSLYDSNLRSTIKNYGSFHATVPGLTGEQAAVLMGNVAVRQAGAGQDLGFAAYAENKKNSMDTPYKYMSVMALDEVAVSMLPGYTLKDGRMPSAPGEIAVDDWALKYLPAGSGIGSEVTLGIGTRTLPDGSPAADWRTSDPNETFTAKETRRFRIVGTLKPPFVATLNFARAVTWLDAANLPDTGNYTAYIELKSVSGAQKQIQAMAQNAGLHAGKGEANAIQTNDHLLRLYAEGISSTFNSSAMIVVSVILLLVVLATIAVIYNAFNISVVERVSQFGLLRCVGATPAQIRGVVFREALILGAVGIPIGVVCGTIAMTAVFGIISAVASGVMMGGLRLILSPWLVVASVLVGAVTIWLSALLPARMAGRVSPMEAVRGAGAFKKEKYRRTGRRSLVLWLLGAEGWMAWKNLGRNRKRFSITVLSMVISIVLFIVFSSLVGFAFRSGAVDTTDMPSYSITNRAGTGAEAIPQDFLAQIGASQGVDYSLAYSAAYAEAKLPDSAVTARAAELISSAGQQDKDGNVILYNSDVVSYSGDSTAILKRTLGLSGLDEQAFRDGEGVILVNAGELIDAKESRTVLTDVTTLKAGDTIEINVRDLEKDPPADNVNKLKILAVVEKGLPGYSTNKSGGVYVIASEKLFRRLAPETAIPQNLMVMMKPGSDHAEVKALVGGFVESNPGYNLTDLDEMAASFRQIWTVMSIFLYGFVTVVSLIGCLNIINTVSTNIILRTRELSVMRAVGMDDGQVRRMVALESVLHGAAAALIGSVAGTALSWFVYDNLIKVREFPWAFPWQQILIAVGAAALVAVVSGTVPLKRINRGVIMEGIRGEE